MKRSTSQRGNVALITALVLPVIMTLLGGALDVARAIQVRMEVRKAVESAVLAAASLTNEREMEDVVRDYLRANLQSSFASYEDLNIVIDAQKDTAGKRAFVNVSTTTKNYFLPLIGIDDFSLSVEGGGQQDWQQVEVTLVLDVSGSMAWDNKIADMRVAAKAFIDTVLRPEVVDITSISVVPFGTHTRAGDPFLYAVDDDRIDGNKDNNYSDGHRWLGCLDIPEDEYSGTPFAADSLQPLPEFRYYRLCANSNNAAIYHLNDASVLKSHIDGLAPESSFAGGTGIDEGAAIGLMALHPDMRGRFSGPFSATRPADLHGDILKVLVVMTDGDMSKFYRPKYCWDYVWYCIDFPVSTDEAEDTLVDMCDQATDDGIMVFAVGFAIAEGSNADRVMADCAPNAASYFLVSATDIGEAFQQIAANINRVRIVM